MREMVFKVRGTVYLAEYSHKHGIDHSVHTTNEGAKNWLRDIVDQWKTEWLDDDDPFADYSLEDLIDCWDEVTGNTEFFNIHELEMQK